VAWRYNVKIIQKLFPGSQVEYLSGAGHQLANESSQLLQSYLERVDAWLEMQGLPSSPSETPAPLGG
jgi:alpha-beta hydrolase superfamily lysophospholipase